MMNISMLITIDNNQNPSNKFFRGVFAGLEKLRAISVSSSPLLSTLEPGMLAGLPLIENISLDSLPQVGIKMINNDDADEDDDDLTRLPVAVDRVARRARS